MDFLKKSPFISWIHPTNMEDLLLIKTVSYT